jgi:hypothetical protein
VPDSPKAGQEVSTIFNYDLSKEVTGGTASYGFSFNGIPFSPTVDDLCADQAGGCCPDPCPLAVGAHINESKSNFPSGVSGKIITCVAQYLRGESSGRRSVARRCGGRRRCRARPARGASSPSSRGAARAPRSSTRDARAAPLPCAPHTHLPADPLRAACAFSRPCSSPRSRLRRTIKWKDQDNAQILCVVWTVNINTAVGTRSGLCAASAACGEKVRSLFHAQTSATAPQFCRSSALLPALHFRRGKDSGAR